MKFAIFNVPHFIGQLNPQRTETALIKASSVVAALDAEWVDVLPDVSNHNDPVIAVNQALSEAVARYPDHFPIILSGDCVNCLGAIKGLSSRHHDLHVIWFDAHGDFNTPETTPSGFLGGMPLAALVGRGNQHLLEHLDLTPLPEAHVYISDARDLDPEEGENLRSSDVHFLPDVQQYVTIDLPDAPLYVHLDVDIVDASEMPGLSYPASNGPSVDDVSTTLARIARDGNVVALLLSLWSTDVSDNDGQALAATIQMVQALIQNLQERSA